jgi:hypothetical protein
MKTTIVVLTAVLLTSLSSAAPVTKAEGSPGLKLFAKKNLVAWCIVPFDAAKRGPKARVEMLLRLGIKRVAYDWRQQHVPTFEEEILQYKKHGIEYFAFWSWHPEMGRLIKKHGITPQIWMTVPSPRTGTQEAKVEAAARQLLPRVTQAGALGCTFGLYNHGGWGGEPTNLVAVTRWLRAKAKAEPVGIVYNLHHGHGHIDDFARVMALMKPYLLCLNLNGMNDNARPKILPVGAGRHDRTLVKIIAASGYAGPIGILDHRGDMDAEKSLKQNLDGLNKIVGELRGQ